MEYLIGINVEGNDVCHRQNVDYGTRTDQFVIITQIDRKEKVLVVPSFNVSTVSQRFFKETH